ncbi:hypothetical protein CLV63_113113 [Murinocardiopsis flavida]|uniref:Mannosylglycerate hydrolase MGH1-like glycoside hydrolase domain-containing protein n=1 Tax=Murinocardiopsis flavida TaxID=645275 RepID=A0A2P8DFH2_9ACTN|nr:hypothetical protein [Murinocardiopsis flavida]PSK95950.1 hypothetical protein CLV63_113113 [Murinocardiopsis flavida]
MTPAPAAPGPAAAPGTAAELRRAATRVLLGNWTGRSTVPSRGLYPHQWSWDSAFIAVGLRHLSPRRAQWELESMTAAQWADGRLPHIVFDPATPRGAYFPGPDFWRSAGAGAGANAETSGIVQPPVHAIAAWEVHRADPETSRRRGFLERVYPRLAAWHHYLARERDLGGAGLAAAVHPWESGMDNSPAWDAALARVAPAPADSFARRDLDHAPVADRPTDADYGRYVRLAADYRDHGYDDARAPHAFRVEDPSMNALLIAAEHALAAIAAELGGDAAAHSGRAAVLTKALVGTLYDPGARMFFARDLVTGAHIAEHTVAGLVPLIVPGLPVAADLVATARGPRFGIGQGRLVPSYDRTGHAFDPCRYWRGPGWFNMSWLVHRGLVLHGAADLAADLRTAMTAAAGRTGFAEYVDPHSGQARGARAFSWTAAVTLDLLAGEAA